SDQPPTDTGEAEPDAAGGETGDAEGPVMAAIAVTLALAAIQVTSSAIGIGRAIAYPWAKSQPSDPSCCQTSSDSTPSATTSSPRPWASSTTLATISRSA